MNETVHKPIYTLVIAWVLLLPLLFFVARGTFSFDRAQSGNLGQSEANVITATGSDSNYYRFEQIGLYVIVIAAMFPSAQTWLGAVQENLLLFSLPLLALASTMWSQSLVKTVPFGIFALILTAFGFYLSQRFSPDQQIRLFIFVGWVSILLSYVLALFYPAVGRWNADGLGAWRGIFIQKNPLGEIMTLLAFAACYARPRTGLQRMGQILYLILLLGLIVLSQSRTAWLVAAISIAFMVILRGSEKFRANEKLFLGISLASVLVIAGTVAVLYTSQIALALGKDPTLTGRTKIWAALVDVVWKRPILGYGYRAFWLGLTGESANVAFAVGTTTLGNSENAVIDMWLELGTVGVFLMFLTLFQACKNAATCLRLGAPKYIHWYIMIVFFNVLSLVDGDKIMFPHTVEWLLFVVAYIGLAKDARRIRSLRTV